MDSLYEMWKKVCEEEASSIRTRVQCIQMKENLHDEEMSDFLSLVREENDEGILLEGFLSWTRQPEKWGSPYKDHKNRAFAGIIIKDMTKDPFMTSTAHGERRKLPTTKELLEEAKRYNRHTMWNVPCLVLERLNMTYSSGYWTRPYNPPDNMELCSYFGSATDEEVSMIEAAMTDEEKAQWELNQIKGIAGNEGADTDINLMTSATKPIRLYLYGTDDTSYTCNFSVEDKKKVGQIFSLLRYPNWEECERICYFSN